MKKIIRGIGIFFVAIMFSGLTAFIFRGFLCENNAVDTLPTDTYKITYRMVVDGEESAVYPALFSSDGNYPLKYNTGEEVSVSELESFVWAGAYSDYTFNGWYMDKELSVVFDGTINSETTGDITLYADIVQGFWSKNY